MAYEQRLGRTNLFRVRTKKSEKSPDYMAKIEIQFGEEIYSVDLAGWDKQGPTAGNYISLTGKITGVRPNQDLEQAGMGAPVGADNEEIPF